jgi:methyl-accepting chemotaxis protein
LTKQTEDNAAIEASAMRETQQTMTALVGAANDIATSAGEVLLQSESSSTASRLITEQVLALKEGALKITEISNTVHNIAYKSNILAFNASLEGAKAGELGKGFAIVADEIRRVAEMVISAAGQIKNLTNEINQHSGTAIRAAKKGSRLAEASTDLSKRITNITTQQQTSTERVSHRMEDIQQFTHQTLAGVQQLKTTADDLVNAAANLTGLISGRRNGLS